MSVTVDANILVYASNEGDPAHERALELVAQLAKGPGLVHLFWPAIVAYLRIVTHPSILPRPLAGNEAVANVTALLSRPHVRAVGELDGFWDVFRETAGESVRGNEIPDGHIAALMRQHGVRTIYTRDRGFRRFEWIEVRNPLD